MSDEDERVKITSDLSDISDAEDNRMSMREQCAQRLFSPDVRTELIVDKTLSPETRSSAPSVISPTLQCKSVSEVKNEVKSDIHSRDRTAQVQAPVPVATGKPKIWSISEIISSSA